MQSLKSEWEFITSGKTLYVILLVPLLVAAVIGYVFSNNLINDAPVAVIDQDHSLLGWTAREPSTASGRVMLVVLPSFLLAGFQVPTLMLPKVLQGLGNLLPITHHFMFIRGLGMRGGELSFFIKEIGSYVIMTAVMMLGMLSMSCREFRLAERAESEVGVPSNTKLANSK